MRRRACGQRESWSLLVCTLAVVALALPLAGCDDDDLFDPFDVTGNGRIRSEFRDVRNFDGVALLGVGDLEIVQSGQESLIITADENLLDRLSSDVFGGELVLSVDSNREILPSRTIEYRVEAIDLVSVALVGVGDVDVRSVDTAELFIDLAGIGDVDVRGVADFQEIRITGVGDYDAPNLASAEVDVDLTGPTRVTVRVRDRLTGTVGVNSELEYFGDPIVDVDGGGRVRRLGPF
ncbi:MAG: DUF2807 domain-containing protein [Acidobacteriota bacterium]